jgi:hypothetical protein
MSPDAGFLTPASPTFDLKTISPRRKRQTSASPLLFTLREILLEQPPLAPNERLPKHLALRRHELALSTQPLDSYTYIEQIDLYIPDRHTIVSVPAIQELTTQYPTPHGTTDTHKQGCRLPICRRANREERALTTDLRRKRLAYADGFRNQQDRRLKSAPAYEAVDPLLLALTVISHQITKPTNQLTRQQKLYLKINTLPKLHDLLHQLYPQLIK